MTSLGPVHLSEAELVGWGEALGRSVDTPVFIGLEGPLGAGKSVLARAIGRGAGVRDEMPSPSYNLLFRYEVSEGRSVVHLDLYRLQGAGELTELGWDDLGSPGELALVEWPSRAGDRLPADRWTFDLQRVVGDTGLRALSVARSGTVPEIPVPGSGFGL